MEDIAIEINNVSKVYKLYDKPIDRLKETISLTKKSYHKDFYALNSINLKIKKGETVGIIGKNGAGKSTLLKIITGVLTPTSGDVKIHGRISSLLELGAGFNPEYTGMENIYLNGTVMGMTKEEVDERLQDVLDFADIGDFINQPVKTYSSGMYVRLAFSVAINVNPDILIVDEALAVGDARFQLKCFNKLKEIKEKGTTILYVSHAIEQVKSFCSVGILIDNGKVLFRGSPKEAGVRYYDLIFPKNYSENKLESSSKEIVDSDLTECYCIYPEQLNTESFGQGGARVDWIKFMGTKGKNVISGGDNLEIYIKYSWDVDFVKSIQLQNNLENDIGISIALADEKGNYIFGCNNFDAGIPINFTEKDEVIVKFVYRLPYLKSGTYFFTTAVACGTQENHIQLRWYDYFAEFKCISCKKNVYGIIHLDYEFYVMERE